MQKILRLIIVSGLMVLIGAAGSAAGTYVSLAGKFYLTFPDNWEQIDYNTADLYLYASNARPEMYRYDAVFAPKTSGPFHEGNYLFLTVDTVGQLNQQQIDSVLSELSESFKGDISYMETGGFLADLKSNTPSYDRANQVVTVLNEIYQGQEAYKKNLVMWKFYDRGIATFYFYSTDSLFEQSKAVFSDIAASFSTEDIKSKIPREQLRVADIKTDEEGNILTERSWTVLYLSIAVFVLIILIVAVTKLRKSK
ncbi:MAG: hypothetical protein JSW34_07560 [Candidatus Zixiibacteriota bacterium]|nr:MAG: hypothetical protein JSW34_07560 [candidate division Zixibacteria bacterium]